MRSLKAVRTYVRTHDRILAGDHPCQTSVKERAVSDVTTHPKQFNIRVNGQHKTVDHELLTYDEVVHLAFADPGNKIYSVSFEKAKAPREGELVEGQSVEIRDGTEFDVDPTGES
jgi:Multiubiquitin